MNDIDRLIAIFDMIDTLNAAELRQVETRMRIRSQALEEQAETK